MRLGRYPKGVTEEEEKAYRRSLSAPWDRFAQLLPVGRDAKERPQFINLSYSMPYDMIRRTLTSIFDNVEEGKLRGESSVKITKDAILGSMSELFKPFVSESIALSAIRDVTTAPSPEGGGLFDLVGGRGGKTQTGAEVYDSEDSAGDIFWKSFNHISSQILPNLVPFQVKSGKWEPSRFAQGVINSVSGPDVGVQDRQGRMRDLSQELSRIFSGISQIDQDMDKNFQFNAYDFGKRKADSATIFNTVARRSNVTTEGLLEAYIAANNSRRKVMEEFSIFSTDAETIGIEKKEQYGLLEKTPGFDAAMIGKYAPLEINAGVINDMRANGTYDLMPWQEIREIQRDSRAKDLGVEEDFQPVDQEAPAVDNVTFTPTLFDDSLLDLDPVSPLVNTQPNIQTSQVSTQRQGPVPIDLIGDFRNMEIANRA